MKSLKIKRCAPACPNRIERFLIFSNKNDVILTCNSLFIELKKMAELMGSDPTTSDLTGLRSPD